MNLYLPRTKELLLPGPVMSLRGRVRRQVVDARNGRVLRDCGWRDNMILDGGLDIIGTTIIADCFKYGHLGTGGAAVQADQTRLESWAKRTSTYGDGDGATTYSGDSVTMQRSFTFPAETGPVSYTEFGTSPAFVDDAALFNRVVFDSPLLVGNGQQAKITMALEVTFSPRSVPAIYTGDIITGWNGSSGQMRVPQLGVNYNYNSTPNVSAHLSGINSSGNTSWSSASSGYGMLCPSANPSSRCRLYVSSANTLPAAREISSPPANGESYDYTYGDSNALYGGTASISDYVPGSYIRMKTFVADLNDLNRSGIRTIGLMNLHNWYGYTKYPLLLACLLDGAFEKANTHRLTVHFNFTWGRA